MCLGFVTTGEFPSEHGCSDRHASDIFMIRCVRWNHQRGDVAGERNGHAGGIWLLWVAQFVRIFAVRVPLQVWNSCADINIVA